MRSSNPSLAGQEPNPIFRLAALAYDRADLIHLEFGEPGFPTPAHIVAAAQASINGERQGYGPTNGPAWLRDAIAARVARVNGLAPSPDQVIVAAGGTGAITASLLCLCAHGDEVLIPDPAWPGYEGILATVGAHALRYPLLPDDGWQPDLDALRRLVTPRTRVVIVNSPSNPGGAVFTRATVEALVDFAQRHDLWLISDECYDELIFEGAHISPAALAPDRALLVGTCSKSYAMTGWRVGWVVVPPVLASPLAIAVGAQVNNLPLLVLRAAHAALTGPQDCVATMRDAYQAHRDLALDVLGAHGLASYTPHGAFYLLVDVFRATGRAASTPSFDSFAFAEALLTEAGIVVAPGSAFGATIPGYVRISLAGQPEPLRAGLEGLLAFAAAWPR